MISPLYLTGLKNNLTKRMDNRTYERTSKCEIEFLWSQFEDMIEHGKNEDEKTKLELLERIYQFSCHNAPKEQARKEGRWLERLIHLYKVCARSGSLTISNTTGNERRGAAGSVNAACN